MYQKSRRERSRAKGRSGEGAGIFIQKITAALKPRRALLPNFTFLVRKRGPLQRAEQKVNNASRERMALVLQRRNEFPRA